MRRGLWVPFLHPCVTPSVGSPTPFLLAPSGPSLPPMSHRYGGFSLGAPDVGLPSGDEVARSLEELRALLSPQPGEATDRILNNLVAWAHGPDAQDSLKVGTGGGGQVASGGRADFVTLTPRP